SMLDAVGFNTVVTLVPPGGNVAAVLVQHNYVLAFWSLSIVNDDGVFGQLFVSFSSQSKRYAYSSPDMDAALAELRVAASTAAKTAALKKIATVINRDMPMLVMGSQDEAIVTTTAVSGIEVNSSQNVVLNRAWMKHWRRCRKAASGLRARSPSLPVAEARSDALPRSCSPRQAP